MKLLIVFFVLLAIVKSQAADETEEEYEAAESELLRSESSEYRYPGGSQYVQSSNNPEYPTTPYRPPYEQAPPSYQSEYEPTYGSEPASEKEHQKPDYLAKSGYKDEYQKPDYPAKPGYQEIYQKPGYPAKASYEEYFKSDYPVKFDYDQKYPQPGYAVKPGYQEEYPKLGYPKKQDYKYKPNYKPEYPREPKPYAQSYKTSYPLKYDQPSYGSRYNYSKPTYCDNTYTPSCATDKTATFCFEDYEYPKYEIEAAIEQDYDFATKYSDVADQSAEDLVNTISASQELSFQYDFYNPEVFDRSHWSGPEGYICPSLVGYVRPLRAKNAVGQWRVIVQDVKYYTQTIRTEKCRFPDSACRLVAPCFQSKCTQKYIYERMLSWDPCDPYQGLFIDVYKVPAACSCHTPE